VQLTARDRQWPARDLSLRESVIEYFDFIRNTAVNKLSGLTEEQARATPLRTSPVMSCLGLVKHLTAVLRQHVVIHAGGRDLPSLWDPDDPDHEFRIGTSETVASVVNAYDAETELARQILSSLDWDGTIEVYGQPIRVGRFVADVLQESARHLGHLDIVRELVDGSTGE
jgi:hypothetical protein